MFVIGNIMYSVRLNAPAVQAPVGYRKDKTPFHSKHDPVLNQQRREHRH